jgi:GTP-binding protein HflX
VNETLKEIGAMDKPTILVFNKIDAFTFVKKDEDDLSPVLRENISLEELKKTWMGRMNEDNCIFISAVKKTNIEELREKMYAQVKQIHITRFPYNDFLYQNYEEQ